MNNNIKYSPTDSRDGTIVKNKYNILEIIASTTNTRQIHIKNFDTDIQGLLKKDFVNLTFDSQDFTYGTIKTITNKSLELLGLRYSDGIFYHGLIKLTKENLILSGGEKYLSSKDITNLTELINNNKDEIQKTKKEILNNKKEIDINKDATNTNKNNINVNKYNINKNTKDIKKLGGEIRIIETLAPVRYPDWKKIESKNEFIITQYKSSGGVSELLFFPQYSWIINDKILKSKSAREYIKLYGMKFDGNWGGLGEILIDKNGTMTLHPFKDEYWLGISEIKNK